MSYEGTVVLNYRLTKKLGEGGFGTVYLAEHTELGRKAACKILHREFAGKPDVVERFFREAKAVCAIGHRAIVDIENFGALPGGEPFYLMEYFPGVSLADHAQRGPMPPAQIVTVFDAVASALTAAHAKQIIHRDLKPENIMVLAGEDGSIIDVKLLDFGIAKLVGDRDSVRSRSGTSMGTPSYMSPEQALDAKSVDVRTDVYSFAATIYTAIAGRPPFIGDSVAVLLQVQTKPPTPLTELVPSAPVQLERALLSCLAKQPAQRPATIADAWREIRHALATAGGLERVDAEPQLAATLPPDWPTAAPTGGAPETVALRKSPPPPATTLGAAASESMPVPARSRGPRAIVAGLVIVASVVTIIVATRKSSSPAPAAQAPVALDTRAADAAIAQVVVDAAIAQAPDPVVVDAAVAVDAAPRRDRPRPRPTPGSGSVEPPPPPPTVLCTPASFAVVYTKPTPTEAEVKSALDRLNKCRGQLPPETVAQIQKNLVSKL